MNIFERVLVIFIDLEIKMCNLIIECSVFMWLLNLNRDSIHILFISSNLINLM